MALKSIGAAEDIDDAGVKNMHTTEVMLKFGKKNSVLNEKVRNRTADLNDALFLMIEMENKFNKKSKLKNIFDLAVNLNPKNILSTAVLVETLVKMIEARMISPLEARTKVDAISGVDSLKLISLRDDELFNNDEEGGETDDKQFNKNKKEKPNGKKVF